MKFRLIGMSFLQFAVWGAYLISMGTYLFSAGMGDKIGYFYAMQGVPPDALKAHMEEIVASAQEQVIAAKGTVAFENTLKGYIAGKCPALAYAMLESR